MVRCWEFQAKSRDIDGQIANAGYKMLGIFTKEELLGKVCWENVGNFYKGGIVKQDRCVDFLSLMHLKYLTGLLRPTQPFMAVLPPPPRYMLEFADQCTIWIWRLVFRKLTI